MRSSLLGNSFLKLAVICGLPMLLVVSCSATNTDSSEELQVTNAETNASQEQYEDGQLVGADNELTNNLTVGAEIGGNEELGAMGEQTYVGETAQYVDEGGINEMNNASGSIADIAAGDGADVLAEGGEIPNVEQPSNDLGLDMGNNLADNLSNQQEGNNFQAGTMNDMTQEQGMESAPTDPMLGGGTMAAAPPAGTQVPEMGAKMVYVVKRGDTLGDISQMIYNDKEKWRDLAAWSGFPNPHLIFPGDLVYYQYTQESAGFAARYEGHRKGEVEVKAGDSLSILAERIYGDPMSWVVIWRYNGHVANPDKIAVGDLLHYPDPVQLTADTDAESKELQTEQADTAPQPTHATKVGLGINISG